MEPTARAGTPAPASAQSNINRKDKLAKARVDSVTFKDQSSTDNLKHALVHWTTEASDAPHLVYCLDHHYGNHDLQVQSLMRTDCTSFRVLEEVCVSQDMFLFLGNIVKRVTARCDNTTEQTHKIHILCDSNGVHLSGNIKVDLDNILESPYRLGRVPDQFVLDCTACGGEHDMDEYCISAIVLIPKNKSSQLVSGVVNHGALLDLVEADMRSSGDIANATDASRDTAILIMNKLLDMTDPDWNPNWPVCMATLAWDLSELELFDTAIRESFVSGTPVDELTVRLAEYAKHGFTGDTVNWDEWLRVYIDRHETLSGLQDSLLGIECRLEGTIRHRSFSEFRIAARLEAFESGNRKLDSDDLPDLAGLLRQQWNATGPTGEGTWYQDIFVPKMLACGSRRLMSRLVRMLLTEWEDIVAPGKLIVEQLLNCDAMLAFLSPDVENVNMFRPRERSMREVERFGKLLKTLLQSRLHAQVDQLLNSYLTNLKLIEVPADNITGYEGHSLAYFLVLKLMHVFKKTNMPPSNSAKDIIEYILQTYIVFPIQSPILVLHQWIHQRRGCGSCEHCDELDEFLVSPTENTHMFINKDPMTCQHLSEMLSPEVQDDGPSETDVGHQRFYYSKVPMPDQQLGIPSQKKRFHFTVMKAKSQTQKELDKYRCKYDKLENRIKRLRGEYMERLLGSEAYDELLILDHLVKPTRSRMAREKSGHKRRANEDGVGRGKRARFD